MLKEWSWSKEWGTASEACVLKGFYDDFEKMGRLRRPILQPGLDIFSI